MLDHPDRASIVERRSHSSFQEAEHRAEMPDDVRGPLVVADDVVERRVKFVAAPLASRRRGPRCVGLWRRALRSVHGRSDAVSVPSSWASDVRQLVADSVILVCASQRVDGFLRRVMSAMASVRDVASGP